MGVTAQSRDIDGSLTPMQATAHGMVISQQQKETPTQIGSLTTTMKAKPGVEGLQIAD
jgi:hypothetical protein